MTNRIFKKKFVLFYKFPKETQDELTTELCDIKEKYREVVYLLRDAQEECKRNRKRTYPGVGSHKLPGIFSLPSTFNTGGSEAVL